MQRCLGSVGLFFFSLAFVMGFTVTNAQEKDTVAVEEDFSQYADAELADGTRRFCTSKIFDQSPNKLISLGYDFQGGHTMTSGTFGGAPASTFRTNSVQGIRIAANFPIVSKTNILINLGANFWESNYVIENASTHPMTQALNDRGLKTTGISATIFKPFNEVNYLFFQGTADLNGDYTLPEFQSLAYTRYSATVIYGWKKHDRLMYGFGLTRTYRVGEQRYIPVFLYNYTFPSRKWGIESVFPARGNLRRTINTRTLAFFGYELEGQTYRMAALKGVNGLMDPELRRSELRIRFTFEKSIKNFIWVSAQVGMRYNWRFNLDEGDIKRGFGSDLPYSLDNTLSNSFYFNLSLNLVSP